MRARFDSVSLRAIYARVAMWNRKGDAFAPLHDQFLSAENNKTLSPVGSGGYDLHAGTLAPRAGKMASTMPQTQAQHAAVMKAGRVSAMKRGMRVGKSFLPSMG